MGEAKRKRFKSIHGASAETILGLPAAEQELLHAICIDAASGIAANATDAIKGALTAHPHGANAVISGAMHGLAVTAWHVRRPGMSAREVEALLVKGMRNALEQCASGDVMRGPSMGGPVQGHG